MKIATTTVGTMNMGLYGRIDTAGTVTVVSVSAEGGAFSLSHLPDLQCCQVVCE